MYTLTTALFWKKNFQVNAYILLNIFQSFNGKPSVFVSAKYERGTKPDDAMYVWLENVNSGGFEVCIREFLPFEGKHQDTFVVSRSIWNSYEGVPRNAWQFSKEKMNI